MRDEWYGDKRDLVKWGSLLLLAEQHRISRVLQIAYYRSNTWAQLEIDGVERPIPKSVIAHFRDVRDIRRLSAGVQIQVIDVPLRPGRSAYVEAVVTAVTAVPEPRLVFLDPDTGLEPAPGKGDLTHVLEEELRAIWSSLGPHDILALYQHQTNRSGKPWLEAKRARFAEVLSLPLGEARIATAPGIARDVAVIYSSRAKLEESAPENEMGRARHGRAVASPLISAIVEHGMTVREPDVLSRVAQAYVAFLGSLPWDHLLVVEGAREGLNKFLSNAYLCCFRGRRKHELTQLVSRAAHDRISSGSTAGLVFEHVVPKQELIQQPCEALARTGTLTPEHAVSLLKRYWLLAMVTKEEDRRLRRKMPEGWEREDLLARYRAAGIDLLPNPFRDRGVPKAESRLPDRDVPGPRPSLTGIGPVRGPQGVGQSGRIGPEGSRVKLRVEIEREQDGRWIAEVPELPGTLAYGSSAAEAQARVQALALRVVADRLEHGEVGPDLIDISFNAA